MYTNLFTLSKLTIQIHNFLTEKHQSAVRLLRVRVHHGAGPGRHRGQGRAPRQQHSRLRGVRGHAGEEGEAPEGQVPDQKGGFGGSTAGPRGGRRRRRGGFR